MNEFNWKEAKPLLTLLAKSKGGSALLWESLQSNQRCALHELLNEGLIIVCCDPGSNIHSVKISEKGYQEVFADSI